MDPKGLRIKTLDNLSICTLLALVSFVGTWGGISGMEYSWDLSQEGLTNI
jgi:hypothetical protein